MFGFFVFYHTICFPLFTLNTCDYADAEKYLKNRQLYYFRYSKLNELFLQNDSIKLRFPFFCSYPRAEKMNALWNTTNVYGALSLKRF